MSCATNEKHASPSGADLNPENRIPPTKGDFDSPIDDAKALLEGRLSDPIPFIQERIEEFSELSPEISQADLAATFPDWEAVDDPSRQYNRLTPIERAIDNIQVDIYSNELIGYRHQMTARYRHEVLQGQRRALVALLAVAEPETFGPIEALIRRQEEELRAAVAAALTPARPQQEQESIRRGVK